MQNVIKFPARFSIQKRGNLSRFSNEKGDELPRFMMEWAVF